MRRLPAAVPASLLALMSLIPASFGGAEDGARWCGAPLPAVVARVGDRPITRGELLLRLGDGPAAVRSGDSTRCRLALDPAIRASLFRPEIEKYRIEMTSEEVDGAVRKFRARFPSDDAFARFLVERDADEALLRRVVEDRLLLEKIEERQVGSWVFGEDLMREYFEEHRAEIAKDRVRGRMIVVKTREEGQRILQDRNLRNRSFAELAARYSLDAQTRERGGDLGWIAKGTLPESLDAAIFSLSAGEISAPVQGPRGYYLLMVEDKRLVAEQTLDDGYRQVVLRRMQEEEWTVQRESWWSELRAKSHVWIAPELEPEAGQEERQLHAEHPR